MGPSGADLGNLFISCDVAPLKQDMELVESFHKTLVKGIPEMAQLYPLDHMLFDVNLYMLVVCLATSALVYGAMQHDMPEEKRLFTFQKFWPSCIKRYCASIENHDLMEVCVDIIENGTKNLPMGTRKSD